MSYSKCIDSELNLIHNINSNFKGSIIMKKLVVLLLAVHSLGALTYNSFSLTDNVEIFGPGGGNDSNGD